MGYFRMLSLVLGGWMIAQSLFCLLAPQAWKGWMLNRLCPEKKPGWLAVFSVVWLLGVGYTWMAFFQMPRPAYVLVTLVMTLSGIKMILALRYYGRLRFVAAAVLSGKTAALYVAAGCALALGTGIIFFSFYS